ncbi:type II toxin-antitoxin system HipA family toxin [Fibrisoma montanum]|uniref:Type II toxin-antitoxin system HipA family toxin n=1 Tax=Fibrisoma montanum TaxID=2305895 RepID=A0A418MI34_9BACT|nr:HipA domain-containing protein [Fibrisoma montanum]RIV27084.1 type II toxin-antitoxin system HipA family toxin [Fibrisoma montanum]
MSECLYCYRPLDSGQADFHPRCSRAFFGQPKPPILPYSLANMHELAEEIVRRHITVTGVQPKLSLDLQASNGMSRLTLVGLWGRYILKPPYARYPEMPENEDLTMHLAEVFGIRTVPHTLIRLQTGELAYLTRRIDRTDDGRKRAMEDFCQLAERLTADKYKGSMELVSRLIRQYSQQAALDLVTLYELTLFCFLTGNADMHLKNYSLWRTEEGSITLTPAYDLLATKLLVPDDMEELALTLNGKKSRFQDADWMAFAQYLDLTDKQRSNVQNRFRKRLPAVFDWIDKSFLATESKQAYRTLLSERAQRLGLY